MSLSIEVEQKRHVSVLGLNGRLTLGDPTDRLRSTVTQEMDLGHKNILLNMSRVDYIDSAGLGLLVGLHTHAIKQEGKLKLVALNGRVINLLQLTKLHTVFDIYDTESAAVLSFE